MPDNDKPSPKPSQDNPKPQPKPPEPSPMSLPDEYKSLTKSGQKGPAKGTKGDKRN